MNKFSFEKNFIIVENIVENILIFEKIVKIVENAAKIDLESFFSFSTF